MVNKKAQMKIQQMAFMLMAITLFFVLVGMFVLVIYSSGLKKTATDLEEKNAMLLATKLANSPEFSCGESFGAKLDCVDFDKAMMLKQNIEKYSGFWGASNIEIRKIFPYTKGDVLCTIATYPDCNVLRLLDDKVTGIEYSNFVSICRKELSNGVSYSKCELGKIMVSYKEKL